MSKHERDVADLLAAAAREDAEAEIVLLRPAEVRTEAADLANQRGPQGATASDVVLREEQIEVELRLEARAIPAAAGGDAVLVAIDEVGFGVRVDRLGQEVEGMLGEPIARLEDQYEFAVSRCQGFVQVRADAKVPIRIELRFQIPGGAGEQRLDVAGGANQDRKARRISHRRDPRTDGSAILFRDRLERFPPIVVSDVRGSTRFLQEVFRHPRPTAVAQRPQELSYERREVPWLAQAAPHHRRPKTPCGLDTPDPPDADPVQLELGSRRDLQQERARRRGQPRNFPLPRAERHPIACREPVSAIDEQARLRRSAAYALEPGVDLHPAA